MKTSKTFLTLSLGALLAAVAAQSTLAQPSSLSITNPVTGLTNVIWDLTLLTNPLQTVQIKIHKVSNGETNTQVMVDYVAPCSQDAKGKLAGAGTTTTTVTTYDSGSPSDVLSFQGNYSSKGSVTGAKGVAKATFATKVAGSAMLQGQERALSASATYTVKFDAVNDQVSGRLVEHAAAAGLVAVAETRTFSDTFLSNTEMNFREQLGDGSWTLVLNFDAANGNKLSGNATVTLASGAVYPFAFTGVYAPKTQQSKLNLKGQGSAKGATLQVTLNGQNTVTRMVGQVAGQSVNIKQ